MKSAARRLALETVGWVLVVAGIAALLLPGPGLLMLFAGLALLSQQYDWAEKRVEPVKKKALKAASEGVETWPRIVLSTLLALLIIAAGVLWIWQPPAPGWWPVDDTWWLAGGWATGVTQVLSGLIAIAMIVYSYRRFHDREDAPV
jgi:sterol desaturase/sphingolipid hydroxylase (fatty acid hydroxylase superfamily)